MGAFGGGQVGSTSTTLPGLARHLCLRQVQAEQAVQAAGLLFQIFCFPQGTMQSVFMYPALWCYYCVCRLSL